MAKTLSGKPVRLAIEQALEKKIAALALDYVFPVLATVRVGTDPADARYEQTIVDRLRPLGIKVRRFMLPDTVTQEEVAALLPQLDADPLYSAVLLFRPLPRSFDEEALCRLVRPEKDVDCMNPLSLGRVFTDPKHAFAPCTAAACMALLRHYEIPLRGKRAVVLGRSNVVGKPLAQLLLSEDATVTVCHSKTEDLPNLCREADILIAACGKARLVDESCIKPGAVVLDVGIHPGPDGLCGDVDFEKVLPLAGAITPVPGGIGGITVALLAKQETEAAERNAS